MAPEKVDQDVYEDQLKEIIQDLYELMIQTSSYNNAGVAADSREILQSTISNLHGALVRLHASASSPSASSIRVPPELIQYVDGGRNPDIYTREFVELARRGNQLMKGKQEAFGSFRDILAREMASALPEIKSDVERVVTETGGDVECLSAGGV